MDAARRSALGRLGAVGRLGAERLLILSCLLLLALLAWAYLWLLAERMGSGDMSLMGMSALSMDGAMGSLPVPWNAGTVALMFLMWWIMMIAMMIPSALPTILLHARVQRHHRDDAGEAWRLSLLFTAGYLAAWAVFSLAATTTQWALTAAGWLRPMTMSVGPAIGAVIFGLAGLYQLSPLKHACLRHCRSPAEFLSTHHRPGRYGAFATGAHHGIYCVGCCWLLMALLFAGGVMNLLWVLALAALVVLEKLLPRGDLVARASGVLMLALAVLLPITA